MVRVACGGCGAACVNEERAAKRGMRSVACGSSREISVRKVSACGCGCCSAACACGCGCA